MEHQQVLEQNINVQIHLTNQMIKDHIEKEYNLYDVNVLKLVGGYQDSNYLISAFQHQQIQQLKKQKKFIVKISNHSTGKLQLQIQCKIVQYLAIKTEQIKNQIGQDKFNNQYFQIVKLVPTKTGTFIVDIFEKQLNQFLFARVFQFVQQAIQFHHYDQNTYGQQLFQQIGKKTANFMKMMKDFDYKKVFQQLQAVYEHAEKYFFKFSQSDHWNLLNFNKRIEDLKYIQNQNSLISLKNIFQKYEQIKPLLKNLPKQIIHHDICKTNILLGKKKNSSSQFHAKTLIDFGDQIYCAALFQLIVACTRQALFQADPLRNIIAILKGYNSITKISEDLIQLIFPLIQARISILFLSSQKKSCLEIKKKKVQNLTYLFQMRDGHKHYFDILSKITNEQFLQRLRKSLKE